LAVPRPSDEADQRLGGPDPLEVLVVGAGAASGWGVLSHSLGLTGALARSLRRSTGRGVVLRSHVDTTITAAEAAAAIGSEQTRFDALRVVVLGVNEALAMVSPRRWRQSMEVVLDALEPSAEHPAVIAGIQPISSIPIFAGGLSAWLDRHVVAMNHETAEACAATPHTVFSPLSAPPQASIARYRSPSDYQFWAQQLTASALTVLPALGERLPRADPVAESERRAELARLGIESVYSDFAIDDVVQFARSAFGTQSSGLMILDDDRAWFLSSAGTDITEVGRESSFTSYAAEGTGALVVEDATQDERFRNNPYVSGRPHVRFFAGHPILGAAGQRIGVLCIYDDAPREFDDTARELLRELARRIQDRLQRGAA
jgi:GAF domain-containing protein